jgi:hypothetical protein
VTVVYSVVRGYYGYPFFDPFWSRYGYPWYPSPFWFPAAGPFGQVYVEPPRRQAQPDGAAGGLTTGCGARPRASRSSSAGEGCKRASDQRRHSQ